MFDPNEIIGKLPNGKDITRKDLAVKAGALDIDGNIEISAYTSACLHNCQVDCFKSREDEAKAYKIAAIGEARRMQCGESADQPRVIDPEKSRRYHLPKPPNNNGKKSLLEDMTPDQRQLCKNNIELRFNLLNKKKRELGLQ